MTVPTFDEKIGFPNNENFKRKLPSEEELKLRIEQFKRELDDDRIKLKRLFVGAACLSFFSGIILFVTWFAWY